MPSLNLEQFGDLVELTIREYVKTDYVSLITDLQDHPAAKALIKKSRMSRTGTSESPEGLYFKVRMQTAGTYRHIRPTTPDLAVITNDFVGASVNWKKVEVGYAFLEEEIDFNMAPNQIVDLVKAREAGADFDFVEGIERDFWAFPSAGDGDAFKSLPYWVTKNGTAGFTGGLPSGYTDVAGIVPATYPRYQNYAYPYTNITIDDMISKQRDASDLTGFKPPIGNIPDLGAVNGPAKAFYTTQSVRKQYADVADSRNDDLGPDVSAMDGKVQFRSADIVWVPALDADTTGPLYQIAWDVFKMIPKRGWWQKRTFMKPYPGQRNQVASWKDTYLNFICFNRRACSVGSTATTYP